MLECLGLPPADSAMLTTHADATRWRVVPMGHLRLDRLRALLKAESARFDSIVAFRPSGWCLPKNGNPAGRSVRSGDVRLHEVPYSEHSSSTELVACVRDLRPQRIVPTVNCGSAGKVQAMIHVLTRGSAGAGNNGFGRVCRGGLCLQVCVWRQTYT